MNPSRLFAALLGTAVLAGCGAMKPTGSETPTVESGTLSGDVSDPRNRAKVHAELAGLYYGRGNMAIALEELRIAVAADPNYATTSACTPGLHGRARTGSPRNFERALRLSPSDPDINHNYGRFLCQNGREADSIKYFLQAVRNPLYATPWRSYSSAGQCAMRKDNMKDAEAYFLQALRQEPDDASSLLHLGLIRYRQGSLEDARKLVARYNKISEPTAESLWLALRVERKLGERVAESSYANQLRRRFSGSPEYQLLQRGEYD